MDAGSFSSRLMPVDSQLATAQIAGIKQSAQPKSAAEAQAVAEDFEAVFMSMLLKQMRSCMTEEGLFGAESSDTYGGIFDMYMGKHLAAGQPMGIGQIVNAYVQNAGTNRS